MGSKGGGSSTTVQKADPWKGVQPYLTGSTQNTIPGLYPEAARIYQQYSGLSDDRQKLLDEQYSQTVKMFGSLPQTGLSLGQQALSGAFSPQLMNVPYSSPLGGETAASSVPETMTVPLVNYDKIPFLDPSSASPKAALAQMGPINPTSALQDLLSGIPNNPYLGAMHQATINRALTGYEDAVQQAMQGLSLEALPAIRSGAVQAGQYGGTRQGLAEGTAIGMTEQQLGRNARDLAQAAMDTGANIYGQAYEGAQQRKADTALQLEKAARDYASLQADMAAKNLQAMLDLNRMSSDTMLGLNEQALRQSLQDWTMAQSGLGTMQSAMDNLDQYYATLAALKDYPMTRAQQMLNWYGGVLQSAGNYGTTTSSTRQGSDPLGTIGQIGSGLANVLLLGSLL